MGLLPHTNYFVLLRTHSVCFSDCPHKLHTANSIVSRLPLCGFCEATLSQLLSSVYRSTLLVISINVRLSYDFLNSSQVMQSCSASRQSTRLPIPRTPPVFFLSGAVTLTRLISYCLGAFPTGRKPPWPYVLATSLHHNQTTNSEKRLTATDLRL